MASSNLTSIEELQNNIESFITNPATTMRLTMSMFEQVFDGKLDIVEPNNPLVLGLQGAAIMTSAAINKDLAISRQRYPVMATEYHHLFSHMSDKDYLNLYSTPSKAKFILAMDMNEMLTRMVEDPATKIRKIVIPRNSQITVAGVPFTLEYPIEIREMQHGGLNVVYDNTILSPIQNLDTNLVPYGQRDTKEITWFVIEFELLQVKINSVNDAVTLGRGFKKSIGFDDLFYYARVYNQQNDGSWTEMYTTFSDQIYDPARPTAILEVTDQVITVRIPQMYVNTGQVYGKVRIDVYETKGNINLALGAYPRSAYAATWLPIDKKRDKTVYSDGFAEIRTIDLVSDDTTYGGANGLSFEQLRNRVLRNSVGESIVPITQAQIEATLENGGYTIVKQVDNLTDREFLATRQLPSPKAIGLTLDAKPLITPAASSIEPLTISPKELAFNVLVKDNGDSMTITPDTVFQIVDGVIKVVPPARVLQLLNMNEDDRAVAVTQGNYLFTPFYYVLDMQNNQFEVRPYYLDSPEIKNKTFVSENQTTLLSIGVDTYNIQTYADGFVIEVTTKSSDLVKEINPTDIFAQLAFVPQGEKVRAYMNGTLVSIDEKTKELTYRFELETNYNVNKDNGITFIPFKMLDLSNRLLQSSLLQDFDIFFATSAVTPDGWTPNDIDRNIGKILLPSRIAGINHEKLSVYFGDALESLWSRSRSFVSSAIYKKYEADILKFYDKDVYDYDPVTGSAIAIVDGEVVYRYFHRKGDPVLDQNGSQVFLHRKGEVMLDPSGNPIIADPRQLVRQINLLMIEGVYFFATDALTHIYRQEMIQTFRTWIVNELGNLKGQLLENTNLFFYPQATLGNVEVMLAEGKVTVVQAGQSLVLSLYVSNEVYNNEKLKAQLTNTSIEILTRLIQQETVSVSEMISELRVAYNGDVIDHKLTGLGGSADYQAFTVMDGKKRCTIRKALAVRSDKTLAVVEDITVNFVRYSKSLVGA